MDLKDNVFVITGGGNGIGRELVLNLLSKGARVAAADIDQAGLDETHRLAGTVSDQMSRHNVDITDLKAVTSLTKDVVDTHGQVDGLINNAGVIQPFEKINDLEYDTIEWVMNVNFFGSVYMTKAFLPLLLERPEASIVNISSMGGFISVPGQGVYGASQAALKLFTEALYAELADTNINVSVVFPGAVNTDIAARSGAVIKSPQDEQGKGSSFKPKPPAQAAEEIINGMVKRRFHIFVGSDSKYMNFLYRISPRSATNFIARQMRALLEE